MDDPPGRASFGMTNTLPERSAHLLANLTATHKRVIGGFVVVALIAMGMSLGRAASYDRAEYIEEGDSLGQSGKKFDSTDDGPGVGTEDYLPGPQAEEPVQHDSRHSLGLSVGPLIPPSLPEAAGNVPTDNPSESFSPAEDESAAPDGGMKYESSPADEGSHVPEYSQDYNHGGGGDSGITPEDVTNSTDPNDGIDPGDALDTYLSQFIEY
jgi:hypothetical protein